MTVTATSPNAWIAGGSTQSDRTRRPHRGDTQFDQQLQTQQSPQSAQAAGSSGGSLSTDLLRMIASHVGALVTGTGSS